MNRAESIGMIEAALIRSTSDCPPDELGRLPNLAASIYGYGVMQMAARLANSRRGSAAAQKELAKVSRDIVKLAQRLADLSPDAVIALGRASAEVHPTLERLGDLNPEIIAAHGRLEGENIPIRTGQPGDSAAREITRYTGGIYRELTGKTPDRLGGRSSKQGRAGFDALLTAVFNALEIEASADYFIRTVFGGGKPPK